MHSLIIGTPAPFRRYIIEKGASPNQTIVLEQSKDFKVSYDIHYRNHEIFEFYDKEFGFMNPDWDTYHVNNINDPSLLDIARSVPELGPIILSGANYVRSKTLLQLRLLSARIVNIHFGDSNLYRGLDSNWWALLNWPDTSPVVTLHVVDNGIDTGAIIKQVQSPMIFSEMSLGDLLRFEVDAANSLLRSFLDGDIVYENKPIVHNNEAEYKSAMPSTYKHQAAANLRSIEL